MGNLQSTPSSSTTTIVQKKYDVFLNFRGEDTRNCFTCHLYEALHKKIETFIDNGLEKGDGIWPTLKGAIEQSKISVVIFSEDYASSKWCLRELVEIMERKNVNKQIVIPVFYRVDPSDVRKQTGSFKDSFDKHGKESQEEVQKWREALTEASNLSGWDSSETRPDTTLVDQIVKDIMKKLMGECTSHDYGALIGHKRIKKVLSLLCLHVPNVQIIGIWGMGGIGKTTIADAIFNKKSNQFEGVCFIQNVRERLQNSGGLVSLRKEILSQVLKDEHLKVDSPTIPSIIKERLNRTKVLIVLDDVDDYLPLENLARGVDRLGLGSRIIITSRDKHVLKLCGVNDQNIYEVEGFNYPDALQLFCNYALHENFPPKDCTVLSNELVNYSKGNPLALKVLGSSLYQKSKQEWESVVNTLRTNLNRGIFDVLKISYDGLDNREKNIFLDIACFFKEEDRDYVEKIIGDCCYSLHVLNDKSLITISSDGWIHMHDLLEEMGREIVDKESPNKPGKRSRLWRQEEVQNTLKYDEGTNAVQGIVLDLSNIKDMQLSPQAFKKMYNLRFLKFNVPLFFDGAYNSKVHFPNGLSNLSDKLSSLIWHGFPLTALPSNFNPKNLVELDLRGSNLERLWKGTMHVPNLKLLILRGCKHLTNIPDLSDASLLEEIDLNRCQSLLDFPPLAPHLKYLHFLDLEGCKSLRSFQSDIHFESITSLVLRGHANLTKFPEISGYLIHLDLSGTAIDEVPPSIGSLTKLSNLNLSHCKRLKYISTNICKLKSLHQLNLANCSALESFPQISGDLESLDLRGSAIDEVPPSIGSLTKLSNLNLSRCTRLKHISTNICKLKSLHLLNLANCSALESFPEISGDLESLDLRGSAIDEVPPSIGSLTKLSNLNLSHCKRLKYISTNICKLKSLHQLNLENCSALESFPEISGDLESLDLRGSAIDEVPPSIGSLTKLSNLNLSRCTRLKHISTNICKLKSLHLLNLANCSALESFPEISGDLESLDLRGSAIDEVPPSIGSLTKLSNLNLSHCKRLKYISTNICKLKSLHQLNLANCSALESFPQISGDLESLDLRGSAIDEVPPSIGSLTKLSNLNLSRCTRLKHISTNICKLKSLHLLNLANCSALESFPEISGDLESLDLRGSAIDEVPPSIGSLTKLSNLNLSHCKRLKYISTNICKLKSLHNLNLANCSALESFPEISGDLESLDLHGSAIDEVPPSIGSLTKLFVNLSNCTRLKHISTNISKLKSLHNLNLAYCSALESFPEISGDLESLDLRGSAIDVVPPSIGSLTKLSNLNLSHCKRLKYISTNICKLKSLRNLNLANCSALESFPEISGDLESLDLRGSAIDEVPPSIGSLTKLSNLNLSQCTRLKHISTNICKLKSLRHLDLENCSKLEIFPEIWETMEGLRFLELSGTAIKELPHRIANLNGLRGLSLMRCKNLEELPSSICHLTSLDFLYLSDCSKLEILPDNFGNLKSLMKLSIDRIAISQLPSTMMHLKVLGSLSCHRCRGLRFTHSSYFPCALSGSLCLSYCNLKEISEDICRLSLLVNLDLSGNDFESLPKSMKQLSKLKYLKVNNCNMLQSLTELPLSIRFLSASDCKQLRSIPDASELVNAKFIFTNCPNLEETAVDNILKSVEGYEGDLDRFGFICPGSEVPERFSYKSKSNESSIKFQMAWHDCFNGLLPEFIVCAVIEFEEYRFDANDIGLYVECRWTFSDGDESDPLTGLRSCALIAASRLINSDHVALWYCKALGHQVLKSEFTNCSFEFRLPKKSPNCRLKSCGVRSITKIPNEDDKVEYAEPIKIFGFTIEDIGETNGKRSRTSDDHQEEEVEPYSKRLNLDLSL